MIEINIYNYKSNILHKNILPKDREGGRSQNKKKARQRGDIPPRFSHFIIQQRPALSGAGPFMNTGCKLILSEENIGLSYLCQPFVPCFFKRHIRRYAAE